MFSKNLGLVLFISFSLAQSAFAQEGACIQEATPPAPTVIPKDVIKSVLFEHLDKQTLIQFSKVGREYRKAAIRQDGIFWERLRNRNGIFTLTPDNPIYANTFNDLGPMFHFKELNWILSSASRNRMTQAEAVPFCREKNGIVPNKMQWRVITKALGRKLENGIPKGYTPTLVPGISSEQLQTDERDANGNPLVFKGHSGGFDPDFVDGASQVRCLIQLTGNGTPAQDLLGS